MSVNSTNTDVLDVLQGTKNEEESEQRGGTGAFTALLFLVFVFMMLVAIVAGTRVYGALRTVQSASDETRLGVSLIANDVRANDAINAVAVGEGPEGRSLVLREVLTSGTYETRIYLYQGNVVEEYTLEGSAYSPDTATVIVASSTFDFSYSAGLLTISCDQGSAQVVIRSLLGGA